MSFTLKQRTGRKHKLNLISAVWIRLIRKDESVGSYRAYT